MIVNFGKIKEYQGLYVIAVSAIVSVSSMTSYILFWKTDDIQKICQTDKIKSSMESMEANIEAARALNCKMIRLLQSSVLIKNKEHGFNKLIFQVQKKSESEIRTTEQLINEELIKFSSDVQKLSDANNCN